MPTVFPGDLDVLTNPSPTSKQDLVPHSGQHGNANDAIEAMQAKIGKDSSSVTTTLDYRIRALEGLLSTGTGVFYTPAPAAGTSSGKDKVAVKAVWDAIVATGKGGILHFGVGNYDTGNLDFPLPTGSPSIHIVGYGIGVTTLKCSVDGATDSFFIYPTSGTACYSFIRDISVEGFSRPALGTSPAVIHGIKMIYGMVLQNVDVHGFNGGVVQAGNHTAIINSFSTSNYYNLLVGYQTTNGDHVYYNFRIESGLKASIGIRADGSMQTTRFIGGHGGFGPYGIYIEARASGSTWAMAQCTFDMSWEAMGHAWIYSADDNARLNAIQCNGTSVLMATSGQKISGEPDRPLVKVAEINDFYGRNSLFLPTDPIGGPNRCTDSIFKVLRIYGRFEIDNFLASWNGKAGLKFISGITNNPEGIEFTDGGFRAIGAQIHPGTTSIPALAVLVNELVQWSLTTYVIPHGYGGAPSLVAGVAMNGSSVVADQEIIVVAKEATSQVEVLTTDTDWTSAQMITSDPSNVGKVMAVTTHAALAGRQLLGRPWSGGAISGGKQAVRLSIP